MMDFNHTEERQMLADTLNRWVLQDYPLASRLDAGASDAGFSRDKWAELAELGVIGALFAEHDGGFGGAGFDLSVVFEAMGRGLVVEPLLQSAVLAAGTLTAANAHSDVVQAVIAGEKTGALAHYEAADAHQGDLVDTQAEKTQTGWLLNGAKSVVRNGGTADFLVVSANTPTGLSLFLVNADHTGVAVQDYQTIDGSRAAEVTLQNVELDASAIVGSAGQGAEILKIIFGRGILCLSAEALGLMATIRDMTIEYLQTRKQFGLPIGKFQALQHRMAEMLLEIEQAKSAVINAAAAVDTPGLDRERAVSAAKYTIGRVGTLVAEEAIQMHGGMGMTWEHPLGHFAKRLVMIDAELGDEDFHLSRYIRLGAA